VESFTKLLKSQGQKIDIAEDVEVLEALATIRDHWGSYAARLPRKTSRASSRSSKR
jgi:hypothetical protein